MEYMGDDTPNHNFILFLQLDGRVVPIFGLQQEPALRFEKTFYGELTLHFNNSDSAMSGLQTAVDNQQVAIKNSRSSHGVTGCPYKVSCRRMLDDMFIEVQ